MKIVHYPHPALRCALRPLTAIDEQVRTQARQMLDLMYEHHGVGLAANQVLLDYQMTVLNPAADPEQKQFELKLINPVILERKGSIEGEEGCLSFPKLYQKVRRAKSVKVQAYDLEGQLIEIDTATWPAEINEMASRALQHEIDHLQGVLYIEKMGPIAKLAIRGTLRDFERSFRRAQERGEIPPDKELEKLWPPRKLRPDANE